MHERTVLRSVAAASVVVSLFAPAAFAQSSAAAAAGTSDKTLAQFGDVSVAAGVRIWANQWEIPDFERQVIVPNPSDPASAVLQDSVSTHVSSLKVAPMPTVAIRAGQFVASATYLPKTGYDSKGALGNVDREEFDATFGYSMLRASEASLLASVGYKHAKIGQTSTVVDNSVKIDAVLVGLTGSAPITDRLSLYGSFAYGWGRQKAVADLPASPNNSVSAIYRVGEIGLGYVAYVGEEGRFVKSVSVTLGYRAQVYTAKSIELQTLAPATNVVLDRQSRDVNSTTQGAVLGVIASF